MIAVLALALALGFWMMVRHEFTRLATAEIVAISTVPPGSRPLVVRFIDRSRRFRQHGAVAGLVLGAVGCRIYLGEFGGGDPTIELNLVVVAAIGAAGALAGSILAEAFRFGRTPTPRVVSLEVRDPNAYDDPVVVRREQLLLASSIAAAALALAFRSPPVPVLLLTAGVSFFVVLRRWGTRRIALRGRPAMPAEMQAADDLVRRMAISAGLGRPTTVLIALIGSFLWGGVAQATSTGGPGPSASIHWASLAATAGSWIIGAVWWFQNRGYGLVGADGRTPERTSSLQTVMAVALVLITSSLVVLIVVPIAQSLAR